MAAVPHPGLHAKIGAVDPRSKATVAAVDNVLDASRLPGLLSPAPMRF